MQKRSLVLFLLILALLPLQAFTAFAQDASAIRGYSRSAGYEYVTFGAYPTDADGTVRPILWRVLKSENGEAYLLSEFILFGSPVHGDYEHYQGWEKSDLYQYLNTVFLSDAFTEAEKGALLIRTEDDALVTLITSDEMKDASIGFSSNADRLCESTAWAKILPDPPIFELPATNNKGRWKPLYIYSKGHKYSPWWSRTRSADYQHEQRRVMDEGKIGRISTGNSDLGVRPAIHVDLQLLSIASGSGALAAPYALTPFVEAAENPQTVTTETEAPAAPLPQETELPAQTQASLANAEEPATLPPAQEPTIAPTQEPTPAPTQEPTAAPTEAPLPSKGYSHAADPATIHEKFPPLNERGFLPDGEPEFVYADEKEGLWLYASQTLRLQINRYSGTNTDKKPFRWFEAQIFTRDEGERFDLYPYDAEHYTSYGDRYKSSPESIARQHHLVFALNSDYFIYRIERDREESYDYPIGVIIRDGEVFYDRPKKASSTVYPPLDVMALYPDGSLTLHRNATVTAKELLAAGASDTLSFGPILVEDGQISPRSTEFGRTYQPRTAFGMVEPGHYIALVVEGKRKGTAEGESCIWLGEKMAELGCTYAMNLDGGATSVMIFMGEQINVTGNYNSSTNRIQNELFGVGVSQAVQ